MQLHLQGHNRVFGWKEHPWVKDLLLCFPSQLQRHPPPVFLNYLPLMGVFIHQLVRKLFWVPGVVLMLELQRWPDNSVRERQVWELLQCPLVSASERERLLTQSERLSRARQRSQRACVEIKCQHRLGVRQQLRNGNRCREQLPWAALDA